VKFTVAALASFVALNLVMYLQYGQPFLHHTFFHHLTRIDHRHNFSPYSTLLYLSAAGGAETRFEALAFLPQLILVVVALPLVLAKKSLATAMLAQTFTFVTFNKVCTSQVSDFTREWSYLQLTCLVFPLVSHPASVLPTLFLAHPQTGSGNISSHTMDCWTGMYCLVILRYHSFHLGLHL
jgi:hypothetical protein